MDKILWEAKKENFKRRAKEKMQAAATWCYDHKEALIVAVPIVVGGTKFIMRETNKVRHDIHEKRMNEEYDRRIYDPSSGVMLRTKHVMSEREKSEYCRLRNEEGMSVWQALKEMDLID